MNTDSLLKEKAKSLLIIEPRDSKDFVIGVPHHAPAGQKTLPCPQHKDSDENAGFLGRYIAEKLNCCSVIACNYAIDSNKSLSSDYSQHIINWKPKILVEIHGHGGINAKTDIEISSGSLKNNKWSLDMEKKLIKKLQKYRTFKSMTISGNFEKIHFKATDSKTITHDGWLSFHIELPASLRIKKGKPCCKPPKAGYQFCDCLIEALKEIKV